MTEDLYSNSLDFVRIGVIPFIQIHYSMGASMGAWMRR